MTPVKTKAVNRRTSRKPQSNGSRPVSGTSTVSIPVLQTGRDEIPHEHYADADTQRDDHFKDPFNLLLALRSFRRLLTAEEVGNLFCKSKFTIYRMVRLNQIPHLMILGSLRFDPSVLELWLIKKQPMLAVAARQLAAA